MRVGGQRHAPDTLPPGRDLVPIAQDAGWAPGLVWTGAENLAPTGIRSLDRPAHSHYTDYTTLDPQTVQPIPSCYTN